MKIFLEIFDFLKFDFPDTNQLSQYTKTYEPIHTELVKLLRSVPDQLRSMNDTTVTSSTQRVSAEINKDLKSMQSNLLKSLKENIKMEVSNLSN